MSQKTRLQWRCRRGMRELDLMLASFLDERFDGLEETEKTRFEQFLNCPNEDLYDWLMAQKESPTQWRRLVDAIRQDDERS